MIHQSDGTAYRVLVFFLCQIKAIHYDTAATFFHVKKLKLATLEDIKEEIADYCKKD